MKLKSSCINMSEKAFCWLNIDGQKHSVLVFHQKWNHFVWTITWVTFSVKRLPVRKKKEHLGSSPVNKESTWNKSLEFWLDIGFTSIKYISYRWLFQTVLATEMNIFKSSGRLRQTFKTLISLRGYHAFCKKLLRFIVSRRDITGMVLNHIS